ncbi:ABC transporter gloK [Fusarium oxysporum f. sp. albedinis]|nr:ABC transporter gloK [Fusarium oxysporum f. sp. albedinis]
MSMSEPGSSMPVNGKYLLDSTGGRALIRYRRVINEAPLLVPFGSVNGRLLCFKRCNVYDSLRIGFPKESFVCDMRIQSQSPSDKGSIVQRAYRA